MDYEHRKSDGTVEKIPDSLKREFKTAAGRKVFDGAGLILISLSRDKEYSIAFNRIGYLRINIRLCFALLWRTSGCSKRFKSIQID
ncbi:MAG: hypothetical protein U5K54_27630 [Cytophagales bacterium]|nr:hypothetical protein [Cytophagales bacterium]